MLTPGQAFWRIDHPWIIITDPIPQSGKVLCVNLTTLDEDCVDDQCILSSADYAWIKRDHPTAVAFSYAQSYDIEKLESAIQKGLLKPVTPPKIPSGTLRKIREVAHSVLDAELRALL